MNHRLIMVPLLICTAMLVADAAHAQARGPGRGPARAEKAGGALPEAARARKQQELEDWLGRLVGNFRIEGRLELNGGLYCGRSCVAKTANAFVEDGWVFHTRSPTGHANCTSVGSGSGIHCIINVPWQTQYFTPFAEGTIARNWPEVGTLAPAMLLLGIDPEKQEISYFQVDDQSAAWWSQGPVKGEEISFRTLCMNPPKGAKCERSFSMHAPRHGRYIVLELDIKLHNRKEARYWLTLHRLPDDRPE